MATETAPDFDLGPLSWVQGEIDQAIARGLESLAAFRGSPGDETALKHARTHVHQAAGAIQMVGLDAVVAYTDELERQLVRLESLPRAELPGASDAIERGLSKLRIFLDELVKGVAPVPLKLFPEYEAMQLVRGVKAASPTELFYPDLSPRAPRIAPREPIGAARLLSHLVKQRRAYQRGLLSWLRGDAEGAKAMREAIAGIEDATPQAGLRSFWWSVGALFEALTGNGLDPGFGVKQLAARIDLQIRRVVEGSAKAADRLRREVLYYVAISAPVGPQVQAVQRAFRLAGLIPTAEALNADMVRIQPLLREAREQLVQAKEAWLKFASGRAENLPKLKATLASVHTKAAEMKHGALMKLTAALVERLDRMPTSGVSEMLAMEYATALLLAESAFENYTMLTPDFPKQVDAMLSRLDAARIGRLSESAAVPALDEMSKRAQERVLVAQVGREIQANLRRMEQVLDAFFRDNGKRADLATLTKESQQIRGALAILGLDDAERLLASCQAQIEHYANPETPVSNDDLEALAEALSGLGFYVEAVEQQRPDRERLIAPLIAKRLGETSAPRAEEAESVESSVARLRASLPALVDEARRAPSDASVRESLRAKLAGLRDDAELIGDAELVAQAESALVELGRGGGAALAEAAAAIADAGVAPAPAISDETKRLLETEGRALDAELLDIYLTEASEVLDTIGDQSRMLDENPGDREALRTVRRGFHTLKGSGRMVGLTELGDLAWDVERMHNRLLDEERPATQAVLAMIRVAHASFRHWVDELRANGRVLVDPTALHEAIAAVGSRLPGGAPSDVAVAATAAAAAPAPVAEVIDITVPAFAEPAASSLDEGSHSIAREPEPEVVELPELGAPNSPVDIEVVETDSEPGPPRHAGPPVLTLIAGSRAADAPDEAEAAERPDGTAASDDIDVGGVRISSSLHRILVDEAEEHLATLDHEQSLLQFDPGAAPSQAMIRAAHTLCGIHRTGGFPLVAGLAKSLELALLALEQAGAPLPGAAQPAIAHGIAALRSLAGRVKARASFDPFDRQECELAGAQLEELRRDLASTPADDFETRAELAALAEEDEESRTAPAHEAPREAPLSEPTPAASLIAAVPVADEPPAAPLPVAAPVARTAPTAVDTGLALPAPAGDPLEGVRDVVEDQVLGIFLEEAGELFPQAGEELRAWRRTPDDAEPPAGLRRVLHTFKGSARMAGAMRLGELAHRMESRLMSGDRPAAAAPALFDALDADLDDIAFLLDGLRAGRTNLELPWVAQAKAAAAPPPDRDAEAEPAPVGEIPASRAEETPARAHAVVPLVAAVPVPPAATEPADSESTARAMLRVRADLIDRLANEAGEVAIARARVEGELRALKSNLLELTGSVIRLRGQVREIEIQAESQIQSRMSAMAEAHEGFDPLEFDRYTRFQELTRSLAEGVNDVSTVQQSLLKNLDDADAALLAQARLSREVQQQLFSIRTVPFGSLSDRLYRIMRATARELDKRANLEIVGAQTELDRSVLERLVGPLEHLLRNALDHGIEPRAARLAAGKSETGEITITVRQAGNEVMIEIADDGSGIDLARVRERARESGFVAPDAEPTDAQLVECIFRPGFTTASRVTQVSGRGVGMDVVRAEIGTLGGRVEVSTARGKGTTFTLYLPLTLAVAQTVLVRAGGRLWALPSPMVEQVQQVKAEALLKLYVAREVEWQQHRYPFHYLTRLLGDTVHNPETSRHNAVLLLRSGQARAAVHVDEMVGNQEVVVKNIGPQLARVSGIAGATVLGNGEIVLIINPVQLAQRADVEAFDPEAEGRVVRGAAPVAPSRPLVLVVDDSLTVRKITGRLLAREGFDVLTARDGIDALQVLAEHTPDVILLDIEMPRMDGFEFTKTIKRDAKHSHIPIIMITSRTAEKHRNLARELGVDLYLGKPFQEEDLLKSLRDMLELTA
ncbi:type IV pili sensor histidine kinase and response regulator,chpA; chemosensory pili system protein ChpA (sensor histidine kinase/response regulator) [Burkholderiales bacterium]|nr:type IV pili sensor histidine kinase and response regulator,chpA; chemosensory pili system protein ChpA (sensor histidine kinase/response regulator) [Burkholderiales bacterium]